MKEKPLRVAVSLKSGLAYTSEILHGIAEYSHRAGDWLLQVDSYFHFGQRPARIDKHWRGHGIILLGGENQIFDLSYFRRARIPVVNATGWREQYPNAPLVFWDDEQIATLAADHLTELGLEHFAYFGPEMFQPSHSRAQAFLGRLRKKGFSTTSCEWSSSEIREVAIWGEATWLQAVKVFKKKLARLEIPVGILANNDITAALAIYAGTEIGLRCPQDLVVVGIWNDKVICESTFPRLTSIEIDCFKVGFEAASILDRMMRDPACKVPESTLIGAKGLVKRESSDFLHFDDELIVRALRFIRKSAPTRPITVQDVLQTVPLSRSSFADRFKSSVGTSAKSEILRVRVEHIKKLLRTTDWTVTRIAEAAGFESSRELARLFRRKTGLTPSDYRAGSTSR